jgi:hypothetical protein
LWKKIEQMFLSERWKLFFMKFVIIDHNIANLMLTSKMCIVFTPNCLEKVFKKCNLCLKFITVFCCWYFVTNVCLNFFHPHKIFFLNLFREKKVHLSKGPFFNFFAKHASKKGKCLYQNILIKVFIWDIGQI